MANAIAYSSMIIASLC